MQKVCPLWLSASGLHLCRDDLDTLFFYLHTQMYNQLKQYVNIVQVKQYIIIVQVLMHGLVCPNQLPFLIICDLASFRCHLLYVS